MYLRADCVFDSLIKNNVLEQIENKWKIINIAQLQPYYCSFFMSKNGIKSIKSFRVSIENGCHIVSKKSIECLIPCAEFEYKKYIEYVFVK